MATMARRARSSTQLDDTDHAEQEPTMNDSEHPDRLDQGPRSQVPQQQPSEIHREREIIVTGGDRRSGASTAIVVIFALIALAVVAFIAFTYFERDGGTILPDEVDINIEVPAPSVPAPEGGGS
jgi:hypothetical protein